jgi:hypothetical protein
MRIRKLAKELETDERAVMDLLVSLGHARYTDPEQQLPGAVEAQIRRHARELPKVGPAPVLPTPRARPAEAAAEPDHAFFERAMAQVRPLAAPPRKAPAPRPPAPPPVKGGGPPAEKSPAPAASGKATAAPPAGKPPPATAGRAAAAAPTGKAAPAAPGKAAPGKAAPEKAAPGARPAPGASRALVKVPAVELDAALARVATLEAGLADALARAEAVEAELRETRERLGTLEHSFAEVDQHRRELQRAASAATASAPLRACFERRGLLGDDEIAVAIRALLDAHRVSELARIEVADPAAVEEWLWERVLLLAEDESTPPGVVAVRVPAERSEGVSSSANRAAMSRFSTACLVRNRKRIVIVGGSPAYHRILREALDPRLDVRLIPGNRRGRLPEIPSADLVILWASTILDHSVSARFPEGVVIPHRSIARMLNAATEWIEGR